MHLALFSSTVDVRNGYGNITYELATHLHAKGVELTLFLPESEGNIARSLGFQFDTRCVLPPYIFRCFQPAAISHLQCIDLRSFDLVHSLFAFPYCFIAARSAKKSVIPFMMGAQGTYGVLPLTYFPEKYLLKWCYGRAQQICVPSEFTKQMIQQYAHNEYPIRVIHNGVRYARFAAAPDIADLKRQYAGKQILLTVGGLKERKGQDLVIRALAMVKEQCPHLFYILVGEGNWRSYLADLAQQLGVADRVVFVGAKTGDELVRYYYLSDIYVHTSRVASLQFEGFGIVYLEAGACGKPVIATDAGGIRDAVLDRETGIVVPDGDTKGIARALVELCHDENRCRRLGENGREYARKHDWDLIAGQYLSLYRTVRA